MRTREEIERALFDSCELDLVTLEVLLDIRDLQKEILDAVYEVDKTIERTPR